MITHKYILRTHFLPFLFSMITLMGVLLLQFLMKFADRLVGKGLDTWLIIQLIVFNLSWMLVLVVPMSTLVATLMAYGNLSQNNEITIIKSSGVSLYKMISAPLLASIVLAFLLFLFNDQVLPDANHRARMLMSDISQKKPTLSLEPGFFSQEVSDYAILVRAIDENKNELSGVTIYDYTNPLKVNVVTAKRGKIFFSNDQKNLIMDLRDGEIHETDVKNTGMYRKLVFKKHRIAMDAEQFSFHQSQGGIRGERELGVDTMKAIVDSISRDRNKYVADLTKETNRYFFIDSTFAAVYSKTISHKPPKLINSRTGLSEGLVPPEKTKDKVLNKNPLTQSTDKITSQRKDLTYVRVLERIKAAKNSVISNLRRVEWAEREMEKYEVEIYKKYSIPAACIVFILIGAPLGIMVRKGGFGVAASISLFFFLLYWAFLIGGEKLAERGFFSPFIGMWAANIVLGIAGILLCIKTNRETVTIQFTFLKKLFARISKSYEAESANENN